MTIEHIRLRPGIVVDSENYQEQVTNILLNNENNVEPLTEGDHELDPIPGGTMRHLVTVYENGTGRYRTISPDGRRFGQTIQLPHEQKLVVLLGESEDKQHVAIHELLFHLPGANPPKKKS